MPRRTLGRNGTASFFTVTEDGSLLCPTCKREGVQCLVWNAEHLTYDYRLRPTNVGERLIYSFHPEIGALRVIVRRMQVHGIEREILAEPLLCGAGALIATSWPSHSIRAYGARIPGRVGAARRRDIQPGGHDRRPPIPLKFVTADLYAWLFSLIEQIPDDSTEFLQIVAVLARRRASGEDYDALVRAYRTELARQLDDEVDRHSETQ